MPTTKTFDGGFVSKEDLEIAIGIDQSLTGFAMSIIDVEDPSKHITWVYKSPNFGIDRLSDIREWMMNQFFFFDHHELDIVDIAIEGSVLQSQAALKLGELAAIVKMAIYDHYMDSDFRYPLQVPPMTLKKFASGKGNSKKQEMLLQIYKKWGHG
jgi:Holliday junction resolvasome RuvABC endonuclease subunit